MSDEVKSNKATFTDVTDKEPKKGIAFETTFVFDYTSLEDGKNYTGKFTARRLNIGLSGEFAVRKARLNGGQKLDDMFDFMHEMVAYCSVALTETPDWWTPLDFFDAQILRQVYDHVRAWEDSFRKGRVA